MPERRTMLVTGGCRSGKSAHALAWAETLGPRRLFLATAQAHDTEMTARIDRHQAERGPHWSTVEEPHEPVRVLRGAEADVVLLDCVTLWLSNLLLRDETDEAILARVDELGDAVCTCEASVVLVANEVGWSIVPENALARRFRDLAGEANQRLAARVDTVAVSIAGLPLFLKGTAP
jgi:adenosylcobinamide kinase/adenosylcobinamide-phosphate guanylyltransferase